MTYEPTRRHDKNNILEETTGLNELVDIIKRIYHCRAAHVIKSGTLFVRQFT